MAVRSSRRCFLNLCLTNPSDKFPGNFPQKLATEIGVKPVTYACKGTCGGEVATAFLAGAAGGYVSSGGNLNQAAISGVEAMAFTYAGSQFGANPEGADLFERSVTEGLIGGAFSEAGGGKFSDGFIGAFVGSESDGLLDHHQPIDGTIQREAERVSIKAILGGTVSSISGGSFSEGAVTDAMQEMFNDENEYKRQQRLKAVVVNQGTMKTTGGTAYGIEIRWQLAGPSPTGGWIVQHIVRDDIDDGNYYEAWHVSPGQSEPDKCDTCGGQKFDDRFLAFPGATIRAEARFYEGINTPESWGTIPQAGILHATTINPELPTTNATAPVIRIWSPPTN